MVTASPIAMHRVAPDAGTVPPRRLAVLARKRLQDLGIHSFIVGDLVRGRLRVETSRLSPWPGVSIEPHQEFVVQGHDRLWLMKPSALRFIGAVPFYQATRGADLVRDIERRWADLVSKSQQFLGQARRYFPGLELDVETWTLDVDVPDQFGVVRLRVRPYQGSIWVEAVASDGVAIVPAANEERPNMQLPPDASMFDHHSLMPLLNRVRSGATPTAGEPESMVLVLDIENTNEVELTNVKDNKSDDLSLDLDLAAILTGDLNDAPVSLDPSALELIEVETTPPEPISVRAPRLKTREVQVSVSTATFTMGAVVRDISVNGVFLELEDPERFALNSTVVVSGIGPFTVRGRVRHRRMNDEGTLLGTGAGVGLELMDPPVARIARGPAPIVVLTDVTSGVERRVRFAAIVAGVGCTSILADDLVQALVATRGLPVRAVLLDQTFAEYGWREINDAFRLQTVGVQLIVVTPEKCEALPEGVQAVAPQRISQFLTGLSR